MTVGGLPICYVCKHFAHSGQGLTCKAFPKGIPGDIVIRASLHKTPYPGDHGVMFEPRSEEELREWEAVCAPRGGNH